MHTQVSTLLMLLHCSWLQEVFTAGHDAGTHPANNWECTVQWTETEQLNYNHSITTTILIESNMVNIVLKTY